MIMPATFTNEECAQPSKFHFSSDKVEDLLLIHKFYLK